MFGLDRLWRGKKKYEPRCGDVVDLLSHSQYVVTADERRNAVDLVPGWNCALPPEAGVTVGSGVLYQDARIQWAIKRFGGVEGRKVLELGPMEASHTYILERAGADVRGVEANKLAFLKCLIAKELLGLKARFSLAEASGWLNASTETYDLIVACGVLISHARSGDPAGVDGAEDLGAVSLDAFR